MSRLQLAAQPPTTPSTFFTLQKNPSSRRLPFESIRTASERANPSRRRAVHPPPPEELVTRVSLLGTTMFSFPRSSLYAHGFAFNPRLRASGAIRGLGYELDHRRVSPSVSPRLAQPLFVNLRRSSFVLALTSCRLAPGSAGTEICAVTVNFAAVVNQSPSPPPPSSSSSVALRPSHPLPKLPGEPARLSPHLAPLIRNQLHPSVGFRCRPSWAPVRC